jgi:hypothetical protein
MLINGFKEEQNLTFSPNSAKLKKELPKNGKAENMQALVNNGTWFRMKDAMQN